MKASEKVSLIVCQLLEATQGAGMSLERSEDLYDEITSHLDRMKEGFAETLVEALLKIITFP
jgi:hypothetical protein